MLLLPLAIPFTVAADPHPSLDYLVSANGRGVVRLRDGIPELFSDHLYQSPGPGQPDTWDLLYDTYFGVQSEGDAGWLNGATAQSVELGTNLLVVERSWGDLHFVEYIAAPMDLAAPGFLRVLKVENTGAAPVASVSLFSLHNYHLGDDNGSGSNNLAESLSLDAGSLVEMGTNTGLGMRIKAISDPDAPLPPRVGCQDIYNHVNNGRVFDGLCAETGDDLTGGFQYELGDLEPGESRWIAVVDVFFSGGDPSTATVAADTWVAGRDPEALLASVRDEWVRWASAGVTPAVLRAEESALYQQSLVYLRTAQVREDGAPFGQIVASLPASEGEFLHQWNIAWVRDGAYAAAALARAGFPEEAAAALQFMVQEGKIGDYAAEVGRDYLLSVCRYYGDGTEWSDSDSNGPNIELDGFGLWLWALNLTVQAADREAGGGDLVLAALGDVPFDGIADVLVDTIDDTGLIMADSSIWEEHWNGQQKHFAYTSAWAVAGLRAAADLADRTGDGRASTYRDAADSIAAAMARELVVDEVLRSNPEEPADNALDAVVVEAFNQGVLGAPGPVLDQTLDALGALKVASGHGYRRNDDGDSYDEQEWVMVDLRLAEAHRRACRTEEALLLEDWITDLGAQNQWTLAELLDPNTADYNGPAPMIGFGAGLYVYQLLIRDDADADCLAGEDPPEPDDSGEPNDSGLPDDSGDPNDSGSADDPAAEEHADPKTGACGCGGGEPGLMLLLAGALLTRRRRSAPSMLTDGGDSRKPAAHRSQR